MLVREQPGFKTSHQLQTMREGGMLVFTLFRELSGLIRPGMTGSDLADWCGRWCTQHGLEQILRNHEGFPSCICLNPGAVAAHGIPDASPVQAGSVCTVDLAVRYRDFCIDSAWTYALPPVSAEVRRLVDGAWRVSARACLSVLKGQSHAEMGTACRDEAARWNVSLMKRFCGHGIGRSMHEPPRFDHWGTMEGVDFSRPGLAVSIEPVVTLGSDEADQGPDGSWHTRDGLWCAQFEHNVAPGGRDGRGLCLTVPDERMFLLPSPPF